MVIAIQVLHHRYPVDSVLAQWRAAHETRHSESYLLPPSGKFVDRLFQFGALALDQQFKAVASNAWRLMSKERPNRANFHTFINCQSLENLAFR